MHNSHVVLRSIVALFLFVILGSCEGPPVDVKVSDIPDFYFENNYLDNRVKVINDAIGECSEDYETFFWITDIHWETKNNTRNAPRLIHYIASKTGIDKVLNGGDAGNAQDICKDAISQLLGAIGSNRVFTVTGNHEMYDASQYENSFARVADELRGHNTDIVYGDNNKSYFFFDNEKEQMRYIGLSTFGLYRNGAYESAYTSEQLEWFKDIALNVKEGWTIVIITHAIYNVRCTIDKLYIAPSGAKDFIDVIDNYKGNGRIACVLIGHTHRDRIHIGSTGVPYIISACDRYAPYEGDINVERIPGTVSEQHFEVVVIDKQKRVIQLFSIGANARDGYDDNPGKEVDLRIVNY